MLVVAGPTAVGKTAFGIQLAQQFSGEIISGDSQQVYRGLDIGTAKATAEEQREARHHLLDTRDLNEPFSASDFVKAADTAITDILGRGKLPIIVGGTGMYLQALMEGYHLGGKEDREAVLAYRAQLSNLTDAQLTDLTKDFEIREPNRRRQIRALEIAKFQKSDAAPLSNLTSPYDYFLIGLTMPREALYTRINARVDAMMTQGLLEEARLLYANYRTNQAAKAIGYKEFFPYLAGEISLETAIDTVKQHSRHYAKRQLTWFRNRMATEFFDVTSPDFPENALEKVRNFLQIEAPDNPQKML